MCKWKSCKKAAAVVSVLAAFHIFSAGVQASGGGIYNEGMLTIIGTTLGNGIHVSYTRDGVHVRVDGQEELFRKPVHTIAVNAGEGDNTVEYHQLIVTDIDLSILTGDGDDQVLVSFDLLGPRDPAVGGPFEAWDQMLVSTFIDTGAGSDQLDFRWNSTAVPALNAFAQLTANGTALGPDKADEVLVNFQHGDPDRPYVLGMAWNADGADRTATVPDERSLVLAKRFTPRSVDVNLQLRGSAGNDEVELHADYTGIRLQQGIVALDADFNEGDNRFSGQYSIAAARHAFISNTIAAGDGDNQISLIGQELTHTVQQRGGTNDGTSNTIMVSEINLGHGDNIVQTSISDYHFLQQLAELGDGDNLIDLAAAGIGDTDVSLTLGDGRNDINIHIVITDGKNNVVEGEALATLVINRLVAGHGDNTIVAKVDSFTWKQTIVEQEIVLGDGDNHTHLSFSDGQGESPGGTRQGFEGQIKLTSFSMGGHNPNTINTTYRSGSGSDTIVIDGEANRTVNAEFVLDPGGENNRVGGHYVFGDWSTRFAPGPIPSQMTVQLLASIDELDLKIEETGPAEAPRKPAEFVIIVIGQQTQGSLEFLRLLGVPQKPAGSAHEPIFVPVRRFTLHDVSADELSLVMNDGDSSVALDAEDITLKRGVIQSNAVAVETLKLANEGWEVELDGLDVFGSFALEQELHGTASSRITLRDVHVHPDAAAYWDNGAILLDIADLARPSGGWFRDPPTVSLAIHDLQVDGIFGAKTQRGDASLEMAMAGATVGSHTAEWTDFNIHDPGITRSAATGYHQITLSDVLVSGCYDISLDTGNRGAAVSYIQDRVATESFLATMDVRLSGGDGSDTILALLRDIVGDGNYNFTADGGDGDDFIAVLARDLDPGAEGNMSFDVLGGDGNDTLALAVPAPIVRGDSIFARIDGGRGFNSCFATPGVLIENCHQHLSDDDILRLLPRHLAPLAATDMANRKEYTDEWRRALYDIEDDGARLSLNAVPEMAGLEDTLPPSVALTVSVSPAGELVISWPEANSQGFVLQATPTLAPANWQPVTTAPAVNDGQRRVSLPATNTTRFFRLHRP